jgi:hypothetical protein
MTTTTGGAAVTRPPHDRPVTRARLALPTPATAIGPVTARRMRRALAVYAVFWLVGSLPGLLGGGPAATAFGLGLVLPGGGFLATGSPWWALLAGAAFVLSLVIWWAIGMLVLPPLVWLGAAALAGTTADGLGWPAATWCRWWYQRPSYWPTSPTACGTPPRSAQEQY